MNPQLLLKDLLIPLVSLIKVQTFLNNKEIFIEDVELIEDVHIKNRDVGKVIFIIDEKPVVVCLKGLIIIKKLSM